MLSYANHQVLADLTLGKLADYRDTYNTGLLQGVPRSLDRDPLGLKVDSPSFRGTDIWALYELFRLNVRDLPQVVAGCVELDRTNVNLIESESLKLYLSSFNQARLNNWDEVRQALERDSSTCAQGKASVALYRPDGLEDQPMGHSNDAYINNQDIIIDNYELTTNYLKNVTSGKKVVEGTFVSHPLKSSCLITHQPD